MSLALRIKALSFNHKIWKLFQFIRYKNKKIPPPKKKKKKKKNYK